MTVTLAAEDVAQRIQKAVPGAVEGVQGNLIFLVPQGIAEVGRFLHDDLELDMKMLRSIDVVDSIDHFEITYRLVSIAKNQQVTLKVRAWEREEPEVPSVTAVWAGADLQEREIYDLMGLRFSGHPNMKRVMLWDGFPGHPWRKDFP